MKGVKHIYIIMKEKNKRKTKKQKQNPERSQAGHLSASISATEAYRHEHGLWDGQDHVGPAQRRV